MQGLKVVSYVLSPNTFERAEKCPATRVYRGPRSAPSHSMWHGIGLHRFLEYAQTRGREAALGYMRAKFKRMVPLCERVDLSALPEGNVEASYLIDTARQAAMLFEDARDLRAEERAQEHVKVRTDLVAREEPWVIDFKSGDRQYDPATSVQSLIEALAVWLDRGRPPAVKVTIMNVPRTGKMVPNDHVFSADDLAEGMRRVRRVHLLTIETRAELREEGVEPEFIDGDHCEWCDLRPVCPRHVDAG